MKEYNDFKYDVAVFGACGHVGLPLSISLAGLGFKVIGVDINSEVVKKVNNKEMPFIEEGASELLAKVIDNKNFLATTDDNIAKHCEYIIIVPGTPVDKDLNTDLSHVTSVINGIMPSLRKGHTIILRSTLAPKTTDYIRNHIEKNSSFVVGKDVFLVYAPERIMQGKAIVEIRSLPQIIGVEDDESFSRAKKLFEKVSPKLIRVNYIEAELAKLFTNNYRYVNFALANEYFMMAMQLDVNIYKIINAVNDDYPRAKIPLVGFAKGPCLGKDSWLLLNSIPSMTAFNGVVSSAYRVNDGLPGVIIERIKSFTNLKNKKIAVLGLTFKKDCDDTRDSLSLKLVHLLKNEFLDVITHDPFVDDKELKTIVEQADIVIIATNHSAYEKFDFEKHANKGTIIVDVWNVTKKDNYLYVV